MRDDAFYVYDYGNCCVRETVETTACYFFRCNDLSGTLQGAGGVGGLLAETKMTASTTNTYYAFGDANGNVTEYADATGAVRGHFEYDAFGEITAQSGDMADSFTHRFSTKPFDVETKLVMYELRPYDPGFGRWLTKDPIGEIGGVNIYVNSGNNCVMNYDCFGLSFVDWLPFAGTLKTIIENMARAIPGQDANNYPASVTLRRCCEAGDAITETECEQINNDMFYQYSRDFSVDAFKGKVLEVVAVVIIKNPAISLAALVDGLTAGINWVDVLNDMRKARDAANEKNCDCSKTGYIP